MNRELAHFQIEENPNEETFPVEANPSTGAPIASQTISPTIEASNNQILVVDLEDQIIEIGLPDKISGDSETSEGSGSGDQGSAIGSGGSSDGETEEDKKERDREITTQAHGHSTQIFCIVYSVSNL